MQLRYSLDWFQASCDIPNGQSFVERVSALTGIEFKIKDMGRFHLHTAVSDEVKILFDKKSTAKNSNVEVTFFGSFFQRKLAMVYLNDLFLDFNFHPTRVDFACDEIQEYIFEEPSNLMSIVHLDTKLQKKFIGSLNNGVETVFAGKSDYRYRYYDKLIECPDYKLKYGIEFEPFSVHRFEVQLRSETLRNLWNKSPVKTIDFLPLLVAGFSNRRVKYSNFEQFSVSDSAYNPKVTNIEEQKKYWYQKLTIAQKNLKLLHIDDILSQSIF